MRLAGSISFNIAEIAGVTLRPRRPVVVLMRRIKMRARRHRIRRRAIAFLVNVDTMLARFEVLDVGDHLDVIANSNDPDVLTGAGCNNGTGGNPPCTTTSTTLP